MNLYYSLAEELKNSEGKRILEVGFGRGVFPLWFCANHHYYGFDIEYKTEVDYSKMKGNLILHDGNQPFPYEDNYFNIVFSSHVLEHIENQKLFVAEMHRVLRDDGVLLLSVPNSNSPNTIPFHFLRKYENRWAKLIAWSDPTHVCEFTRKSISELLTQHHFEIKECTAEGVRIIPTYYLSNRFRRFIGRRLYRALGSLFPESLRSSIQVVAVKA